MKKLVFAVFCMAASVAWAQDGDDADSERDEKVELRVSVLEEINVTADKTPAVTDDEQDDDIDKIIDEAEAMEFEEDSE